MTDGTERDTSRPAASNLVAGLAIVLAVLTVVAFAASAPGETDESSTRLGIALLGFGIALAVLALAFHLRGRRGRARTTLGIALLLLVLPAAVSFGVLGFFLAGLLVIVAADLLLRQRGKTWEDEAREQWAREESGA